MINKGSGILLKNPENRHCEVAVGDRGNLKRCARQTVEIATPARGRLAMTITGTFSTGPFAGVTDWQDRRDPALRGLHIFRGPDHGTDIINNNPEAMRILVDWLCAP